MIFKTILKNYMKGLELINDSNFKFTNNKIK